MTKYGLTPEAKADRLIALASPDVGSKDPTIRIEEIIRLIDQEAPERFFLHLLRRALPEKIRLSVPAPDGRATWDVLRQHAVDLKAKISEAESCLSAAPALGLVAASTAAQSRRHREGMANSGLCFFHKKFKESARNCRPGCRHFDHFKQAKNA